MTDIHCEKCFGTGERHNGYFQYPCSCNHESLFDFKKINNDVGIKTSPKQTFETSPFSLVQIQYLRGLVVTDQFENNYEELGMNAKIDQQTSMYDFTGGILKILDSLEDGLGK